MFIVELTVGLLLGAVAPHLMVRRLSIRPGVAAALVAVVLIVFVTLPIDLSLRVGVGLGVTLGLLVMCTYMLPAASNDASSQE